MRRASQKKTAPVRTTFASPPDECVGTGGSSSKEAGTSSGSRGSASSTEILLSAGGTFSRHAASATDPLVERRRGLAIAIRQRIETRLGDRIRDLCVRVVGNTIVLEGRCATYYSKQLAQHAALGILEDEQLENAIVVAVPR